MGFEQDRLAVELHPKIARFVRVLQEQDSGQFGICCGKVDVADITSGATSLMHRFCGDRFKLTLPYGGSSVIWEVLFNACRPDESPDFIFLEDEKFIPDPSTLPSLTNWDEDSEYSLLRVVEELLEEYRKYQIDQIQKYERLQFEYSSLTNAFALDKKLEVHINWKNKRINNVNFLIKLDVNFSSIPSYLTKDNPGEDSAVLLVKFYSVTGAKVTTQLFLSPRVENSLGGATRLRTPGWPSNGCLLVYVPYIITFLQHKVAEIERNYFMRRDMVTALLSQFGRSVTEHESESYHLITFLLEWNDFFFIVHFGMGEHFPDKGLTVKFQSVYHEDSNSDSPYEVEVDNFPYSPRWTATEVAERAKNFIDENVPQFQKDSVKYGIM